MPIQATGYDSGVFACQTLAWLARGKGPAVEGIDFLQQDLSARRDLIILEISEGDLKW